MIELFIRIPMYSLFTNDIKIKGSVIKPPNFEYLKRAYTREIEKLTEYYRSRSFFLKSDHLLCRIINMTMSSLDYDINRFMEVIDSRSIYISRRLKITSSLEYGILHQGVFYGDNCKEFIFYDDSYFNYNESKQIWKSLQSVKVLDNICSSTGLLLPNGKINFLEKGRCSLSININMLMFQYYCFLKEKQLKELLNPEEDQVRESISIFVYRYVLPNMLYTHIDHVIFNRLINLYSGKEMGLSIRKHPVPIYNYNEKLDSVLNEVLNKINNSRSKYSFMLQNIPSVFQENIGEVLMMPDIPATRQAWWVLLLTRLKTIMFLIQVGGSNGIGSNRELINKLKIDIKRLNRENLLMSKLPVEDYSEIKEYLDFISDI